MGNNSNLLMHWPITNAIVRRLQYYDVKGVGKYCSSNLLTHWLKTYYFRSQKLHNSLNKMCNETTGNSPVKKQLPVSYMYCVKGNNSILMKIEKFTKTLKQENLETDIYCLVLLQQLNCIDGNYSTPIFSYLTVLQPLT